MNFLPQSATEPVSRLQWLRIAFIAAALLYAAPIASNAYDKLTRVNKEARSRLIQQHRLWELEIGFRGRPELWTRMAAHLLNDHQLLARVALKYGGQSTDIEVEYRRDVSIARAEVVLSALALWAGPLAALYGIGWLARRRLNAPKPKPQPASVYDPRYQPPA